MTRRPIDLHAGGPPRQPRRARCEGCDRKAEALIPTRQGYLCLGCKAIAQGRGEPL